MRVTREQAAANRERVIETASRLFRERGFDGVGVADLMKAAGLTHGGFYGQFASKDALAVEVLDRAMERTKERWEGLAATEGKPPLEALVDHYLSARHRDGVANGCAFAALSIDVARHGDPALRRSFTEGLEPLFDLLRRIVPDRASVAGRRKALAAMAELVGAVILARAVDDPALSDDILAAARDDLLGPPDVKD